MIVLLLSVLTMKRALDATAFCRGGFEGAADIIGKALIFTRGLDMVRLSPLGLFETAEKGGNLSRDSFHE